ncbi:MAG TPA: hypothetical protein VGO89_09085 [Streptomyces sp.]|nr:hypothetical protein [Streptomyces sp.]
MSRETDRSSSGPQGRGGSYPPGAEPYGPGAAGDSGDAEQAPAAGADPNAGNKGRSGDRKTETTLTTRIRISIPGSRPIPPVVMRTPVNDSESEGGTPEGGPSQPLQADDRRPPGPPGPSGPGQPGMPGSPQSSHSSEDTSGGGELRQEPSDWFAPRRGKPGSGGGSGTAGGAGIQGGPSAPAGGAEPSYGTSDPYGVENPYGVGDLYRSTDPYDTGSNPFPHTDTPAHGIGTDGPTTGPASGDMPLPSQPGAGGGAPAEPPASSTLGLGAGVAPFAPGGAGEEMLRHGPGGRPGGDEPGDDHVVSNTLVGRGPRTPAPGAGPAAASPFQGADHESAGSDSSGVRTFDDDDELSSGRSKLVLVGVGLAGLIGIAYGAGLLFDHADVPNGTVVLGVDIGGTSRHEAVNKLDAAFGDRTTQPFTVVAGGQRAKLKPSVAGMTLDTEATVRNAAGRDYNPVSVIGSLFGADRDAQPALKVDGEKMASALTDISRKTGDGGAPKDGMVKFINGKAVAVPGRPHKGIDPREASSALQDAYRARAATGNNSPVELPVSLQQPRVGKQELNRAIKDFGKPAMSGLVTIKAGDASIQFSPQKSLPKFLSMKPVNGTLVDTYDLPVLQDLYGTTFQGVKIARGDGSKTPVTPQDVAGALRLALKETSPAKRVQEIQLNAQ